MKRLFYILVLLAVTNVSLLAGNPSAAVMFVTGTVVDYSSNETLAGVEVRVKGTDIVTYTDFDGNFYLPAMAAGTYTLEFNYITYSSTAVTTDGSDLEPELAISLRQR